MWPYVKLIWPLVRTGDATGTNASRTLRTFLIRSPKWLETALLPSVFDALPKGLKTVVPRVSLPYKEQLLKIIWLQSRIAAAHGWVIAFARWRQCALPFTMLPWTHPNPHPKRHLDWFSRFAQLTAENPYTLQLQPPLSPSKSPIGMGICTQSNTRFFGPTRFHNPDSISIGSVVFAGFTIVTDRPTDRQTTLLGL